MYLIFDESLKIKTIIYCIKEQIISNTFYKIINNNKIIL